MNDEKYVKYPRTLHFPWSHGTSDDKVLTDDSQFYDCRVIVTLKMDGENTSIYNDYIHARSIDSGNHESRSWVKQLQAKVSYMMDDNMRICGENLYAKHSIGYDDLSTYFMAFSLWFDNKCLSWDETVEYLQILNLEHVPVIYDGIYDREKSQEIFKAYENNHEGYVVRVAESFNYTDFKNCVAKYVREEFKQLIEDSEGHWMTKKVEPNTLKNDA